MIYGELWIEEKALQVKRRFLNCVSHEMRTPLNAIAGFAAVLTTHSDELEPDEKADLSRRIICNVPIVTHVGTRQGQTIVSDSA